MPVAAPDDPRLADYTQLTDVALRRVREPAEGLFMAESLTVIDRALAAGYQPRSVLSAPRYVSAAQQVLARHGAVCPVYTASAEVLRATTGFRMHRGPMAAMQRRALPELADVVGAADHILVLAGLVDHTNVGAAFRSAAALGIQAVLVTSDCADPLYRRSVRVSMGTVFSLPWTKVAASKPLMGLHDAGFTTVALSPDPAASDLAALFPELGRRIALVVGTEGPGLDHGTRSAANRQARIPMTGGVDSLNVAAAVAVACYALTVSRGCREVT